MNEHIPAKPVAAGDSGALEVCSLGLVDFDSAWHLQERLIFSLGERSDRQGHLLLCEHPGLITMGREASRQDLLISEIELERRGIELRWIGRAGGAFAHGPGQLSIYLLLPLSRLGISILDYRVRMEAAMIASCRELRVCLKRDASSPGLWGRGGQVALFGAAVRDGVTCHGMYLNVHTWPGALNWTRTCAEGDRQTSLQAMSRRPMPMGAVRETVARQIAAAFDYSHLNYATGHPMLVRTRRKVCLHA